MLKTIDFKLAPIQVINPKNGELVNVAPLLELLDVFGGIDTSPNGPAESLADLLMILALTPKDDFFCPHRIHNLSNDLYMFKEMFEEMAATRAPKPG